MVGKPLKTEVGQLDEQIRKQRRDEKSKTKEKNSVAGSEIQ